ncbi:hypothetical protein OC845_005281 [Tilletia horrida]|nr:hypothetical protein OC845_005281 [Tilletia horrida]
MPGVNVSNELEWLLTRRTSSYIVKQASLPRVFTREPANLTQLHSFKYSSTTNNKNIGIEAAPGGRGVVVVTRKGKASRGAVKGAYSTTTLKKGGSRRSAGAISNIVHKNGYRRDLTQVAVARASALHRSQRSRKAQQPAKPRGKKASVAAPAPAAEETA